MNSGRKRTYRIILASDLSTATEPGTTTFKEAAIDSRTPGPQDLAADRIAADSLREVIRALPKSEGLVIEMLYGLSGPELTFEDIGRIFEVTRESIRSVQLRALRRLALNRHRRLLLEKIFDYSSLRSE